MIFGYLILAHLLADFIFQPQKLTRWKEKTKWAVLFHVFIHFLIGVILLAPVIINGYFIVLYAIFFINFVHFWIDVAKVNYSLKSEKVFYPFLLDQLMHFITILGVFLFIKDVSVELPENGFYSLYQSILLIVFLTFIVFLGKTIDIVFFQKEIEKDRKAKFKVNKPKMFTRIITFTIFYIFFLLTIFLIGS